MPRILGYHEQNVTSVSISNDYRFVISGGCDSTIRLWDLQDSSRNQVIGRHDCEIFSVCISSSNSFVVSGD